MRGRLSWILGIDRGAAGPKSITEWTNAAEWTQDGLYRRRAGKELAIRLVTLAGMASWDGVAKPIRTMLEDIGVRVQITLSPFEHLFDDIGTGNFDVVVFYWAGNAFPISSSKSDLRQPEGR